MKLINWKHALSSISWFVVILLCISFSLSSCKDSNDEQEENKLQRVLALNVSEGKLSNLISVEQKYSVEKLILTGKLNGDDISFLREMAGIDRYGNATGGRLEYLDMKNAQIVKGGGYYFMLERTSNDIIGDNMFGNCFPLKTLILPSGTIGVGTGAFSESGLTAMTIPDSVKWIEESAFSECDSLRSITMSDNVTSLGYYAFFGCESLTDVRLSDSIKTLSATFCACHSLVSVKLPKLLTKINSRVFYDCSHLLSVDIPASVNEIGDFPFDFCPSLKAINVDWKNKSYSSTNGVLFNYDGNSLIRFPSAYPSDTYTIPSNVSTLSIYAFLGSDSLRQITIPSTVNHISYGAFLSCFALTDIYMKGSCPEILYDSYNSPYNTFEDITFKNCTLHVPYQRMDQYKANWGWKHFANIDSF